MWDLRHQRGRNSWLFRHFYVSKIAFSLPFRQPGELEVSHFRPPIFLPASRRQALTS